MRRRRAFGDEADRGGLREHGHHPGEAEPARSLEHMQVELASDDSRQPKSRDGLAGKGRHAAADQGPDFLRDAEEGIFDGLVVALKGVARHQLPNDLSKEVRIASRELVQPRDGPAAHRRPGHRRNVRLDVRRCQAPKRDPPSRPVRARRRRRIARARASRPPGRTPRPGSSPLLARPPGNAAATATARPPRAGRPRRPRSGARMRPLQEAAHRVE